MGTFRVKEICKSKGITLADLATRLDITASALSQMLNGANPTLSTLKKVAEALGVELTDIFEREAPIGIISYKNKTYTIQSRDDIEAVLYIVDAE